MQPGKARLTLIPRPLAAIWLTWKSKSNRTSSFHPQASFRKPETAAKTSARTSLFIFPSGTFDCQPDAREYQTFSGWGEARDDSGNRSGRSVQSVLCGEPGGVIEEGRIQTTMAALERHFTVAAEGQGECCRALGQDRHKPVAHLETY